MLLCLTIIGIPLGFANFKLIPVTLTPFGRDIVSIEEAQRTGLQAEVVVERTLASASRRRGGDGTIPCSPPVSAAEPGPPGPAARRAT